MKLTNKINHIIKITYIIALALTINSCRQENEEILNYARYDYINNNDSSENNPENSFAGTFDALWNAINNNYVSWDIETIDWDSAYNATMPQLKELDKRNKAGEIVSDEELKEIYDKLLINLHDGHALFNIKNISTDNYISVIPSLLRNKTRKDFNDNPFWNLSAYNDQLTAVKMAINENNEYITNKIYTAYNTLNNKLTEYEKNGIHTEEDNKLYNRIETALDELKTTFNGVTFNNIKDYSNAYNNWCIKFSDMGIKPYIRNNNESLCLYSAIFSDGIAYMRISNFKLGFYFDLEPDECTDDDMYVVNQFKETWNLWFDSIQELAKNGRLKGVIIDVRNNGGGYCSDYKYIIGALLSQGTITLGTTKMKNGLGRLDYGPSFPIVLDTYNNPHETINQPIVVLANCQSVSMAEITTATAKMLDNGTVIGTRTWGGTGFIQGSSDMYSSSSYSGTFGVENNTLIYGYLPFQNNTLYKIGNVEGKGIYPDIEIEYNENEYNATGHDNQLDAALNFIRNK